MACASSYLTTTTAKIPGYVISNTRNVAWTPINDCVPAGVTTLEDWFTWFETGPLHVLCDLQDLRFQNDSIAIADGAGNINVESFSNVVNRLFPNIGTGAAYDLPDSTAANQIFIANGAGDPSATGQWLGLGAAGQVLSVNAAGNALVWTTPATGGAYDLPDATDIEQIFISTAAGDPSATGAWISKGQPGQSLSVTNDPGNPLMWVTKQDGLPVTNGTGPQLFIALDGGTPLNAANAGFWLDGGAGSQCLCMNAAGTNFEWTAPGGVGGVTLPDPTGPLQILASTAAGAVGTGTTGWLPRGLPGQSLTMHANNTQFEWRDKQDELPETNPSSRLQIFTALGGAAGTDPANTGIWLDIGGAGECLCVNAAGTGLEWTANAGAYDLPDAPGASNLFISIAGGDPSISGAWLAPGNFNEVLAINAGGALEWKESRTQKFKATRAAGTDTIFTAPTIVPFETNVANDGSFVNATGIFTAANTGEHEFQVSLEVLVDQAAVGLFVGYRATLYNVTTGQDEMLLFSSINHLITNSVVGFGTKISVDCIAGRQYGVRVYPQGTGGDRSYLQGALYTFSAWELL